MPATYYARHTKRLLEALYEPAADPAPFFWTGAIAPASPVWA